MSSEADSSLDLELSKHSTKWGRIVGMQALIVKRSKSGIDITQVKKEKFETDKEWAITCKLACRGSAVRSRLTVHLRRFCVEQT